MNNVDAPVAGDGDATDEVDWALLLILVVAVFSVPLYGIVPVNASLSLVSFHFILRFPWINNFGN